MFQGIKDWYTSPYRSDMDVKRWFLFVGLLLVILAVWKIIVSHLMD